MRTAIVLATLLATGPVMLGPNMFGPAWAADTNTPDCAAAETPAAQLVCRDASLGSASDKLDGALKALGDEAGEAGRAALASAQRAWVQRRDAACPVTEQDLADPKKSKDRAGCLSRQIAERTKALEEDLAARRAPVASQPVTITDAAPPRAVAPAQAVPMPPKRQAGVAALIGRWSKADPVTRTPIDDCRGSYLEITKEPAINLHDPRVAGFPVQGRVTVEDGDPVHGLVFRSEGAKSDVSGSMGGPAGTLRLDPADTPRLDRLFLRLEQPVAFGATFVRCR